MEILYLGAHPQPGLSHILRNGGNTLIEARYTLGLLRQQSSCAAVVLHWKSDKDRHAIAEAASIGLPVLVITAKLGAAFRCGKPFADVYLEAPASNQEVSTLLTELIAARLRQMKFRARSVAA